MGRSAASTSRKGSAPPNDEFENATPLSGLSAGDYGYAGDRGPGDVNATSEPGEPNHAGNASGQSLWWRWTAPANVSVQVDTCSSLYDNGYHPDTVLAVYTGDTVDALSPVASNDDLASCAPGSGVAFTARAGQTYRIAVDGAAGSNADGVFVLSLRVTAVSGGTPPATTPVTPTTRQETEVQEEAQALGRERQEEVQDQKEAAAIQAGLMAGLGTGERTFDAAARGGKLPRRAVLLALVTSAHLWRVLAIGLVGASAIAATALAPGAQAVSSTPDKTDVTNGIVNAVVPTPGAIYIGGKFTQVGPGTGTWVGIDSSTAAIMGLPQVSGGTRNGSVLYASEVRAAAPDGSGGYYIGGGFTHVGGLARRNLAHILADGSVDPNFAPNPNREVHALAVSGSTVYVGGAFSSFNGEVSNSIGGQPRDGIAALDAATGNATSWDPSAGSQLIPSPSPARPSTSAAASTASAARSAGASPPLDAATGAATSWNANAEPNATDYCRVARSPSPSPSATVYVGGDFDHLGGQARNNIAELDAATGAATSWNPNAQGGMASGSNNDYTSVDALAVSGSLVYARRPLHLDRGRDPPQHRRPRPDHRGGDGLEPERHGHVAGTRPQTATSTRSPSPARPSTPAASSTTSAASPATVSPPSTPRPAPRRAGTRASTGASANPGIVYTLAVSGSTVYAGGFFAAIGGQARRNVAALDPATGEVTSWNPNADGEVDALDVCGSTVYAGGDFTSIGGQFRNRIGALDAATGNATSWNPNADGEVDALHVSPSAVYAGGTFTSIGGKARNAIAALNAATGNATSWNPNANGEVDALHVSPSAVYAGGRFDHIGGQARNNIAALDAATGNRDELEPGLQRRDQRPRRLRRDRLRRRRLLLCTSATRLDRRPVPQRHRRPRRGHGQRDELGPEPGSGEHGGRPRRHRFERLRRRRLLVPHNIAAFNRTTGAASWGPIANGEVRALEFGPDGSLWVGGAFTEFDAAPQSGIARFAPTQDRQSDRCLQPGPMRRRPALERLQLRQGEEEQAQGDGEGDHERPRPRRDWSSPRP